MNLCPHSDTGRRNDQKQGFRSRLEFDNTIYKSATEALEAYIAQFKGGRSTTYRRRPSDLLSPAPKYYFMDSLERRLKSPPSKSPARKVDELLEWVNVAYAKELSSKVSPFGYRTTPELPGSDEENMNPHPAHGYHSHRGNDDELSTLPSPSSSVVDLDSNAGTVETEVLMSSYKGIHTSASGSYSNMAPLKSPPKLGARPDGSTEYPSWVSGLGKEYPSWVEDLDRSIRHRKVKQSPDTKYSSSSSSTSASETRKKTSMRPSRSTPALKVSDLQKQTRRPQDPPRVKMAESRMNGTDWNDAASTDTDMLVSQSVYGPHPVNMGGDFHNSLYQDKIVARLKKESTKKLRKSTGKVKSTEHSTVSSRRSKSRTFTPTKTLRFSARDGEQFHENSENKKSTPVRTGEMRESSPEDSPFTALPARYSLPPQNERYRISEEAGRRSASPPFGYSLPPQNERYRIPEEDGRRSASPPARYSLPPQNERYRISEEAVRRSASPPARYGLPPQNERYRISEEAGQRSASPPSGYSLPPQNERYRIPEEAGRRSALPPSNQTYISPPAVARYSQPSAQTLVVRSSRSYASASASKSPSRGSMPLKINIPEQREDSDVESEDTDRVMRKSPTGIKMEKMYRDPNTMYPWKTMIQSSRSQNTSDEFAHSKPQYHSTPMVYAGREPSKSRSSAERQHYSEGVPRGSHRSQQRVAFSEVRSPHRDRQARTAENFKLTPKAVFASSSYRSRDEKLAKYAPNARYSKPPPVPRSSGKNFIHRRSKTVPDLRRIAISSATAPRHSRRSLDDDVISVNTADTETLITRPPMPVFYVSPSLTTVSDSETLVESETETETELDVARPRHLAAVQHDSDKFSPTSVFASTNPHAAVREELPERFHLWKLDEDTKAPDSFIKRRFTSPKSGIISAFLEDCLSVESDDPKLAQPDSTSPATRLSGKEAAPGPVEALKQMLFTMQDMAHHETLDNGHYYQASSNTDFKSREVKDPSASDDQSERDLDVFGGEVSLQRAYHHLERLKRLVGREDDQSSTSSAN